MSFVQIYLQALIVIMAFMTILWIISVIIRNASIADIFWGTGFIITGMFYYFNCNGNPARKLILIILIAIWGLRLSLYLAWRNIGKGEDFRYREFRRKYGETRYWWISFFQTFLLQGVLMWLISAPLLGAQYYGNASAPGFLDFAGIAFWSIGILFETGGDLQLARFRSDPSNKGQVLSTGFWKYTRHPNYFGDSSVWWGFAFICASAGGYIPILGSVLMTALIIKVSGVALLEKTLKEHKPGYREYAESTSAFIPWFPRKKKI